MEPLDVGVIAAILMIAGAYITGCPSVAVKRAGDGLVYAGLLCWLGCYLWWLFG